MMHAFALIATVFGIRQLATPITDSTPASMAMGGLSDEQTTESTTTGLSFVDTGPGAQALFDVHKGLSLVQKKSKNPKELLAKAEEKADKLRVKHTGVMPEKVDLHSLAEKQLKESNTFAASAAAEKQLATQAKISKSKESVEAAASETSAAAEAMLAKHAAEQPAAPTLSPKEQIVADLHEAQNELKWRAHSDDATRSLEAKMEKKAADLAETRQKLGMPLIQGGKVDTTACVNILADCETKANAGQCAANSLTAAQCPKSCDAWASAHGLAAKYCTRVLEAQQKNKSANTVPHQKTQDRLDGLLQFMQLYRWYFMGVALVLLVAGLARVKSSKKAALPAFGQMAFQADVGQ